MNDPIPKTDAGATAGSATAQTVASDLPKKPVGVPPAGNGHTPPLPAVPIGKPGYSFKFDANTPQGQDERREHERIRKNDKRAAHRTSQPSPLSPPPPLDTLQASSGEQVPGNGVANVPLVVEFIPWIAADVSDFTDELVELSEVKRVSEFVQIARDAKLPVKLIAEIETKAHFPKNSKAQLKRTLGECVAKWMNKTGISSARKEEVKLLFTMFTVKLQGVRLKRDLVAMIEDDKAERAKQETTAPTTKTP